MREYGQRCTMKVMIIDDELNVLISLSRVLTRLGYSCSALSDATDIYSAYSEIHPDVIISDYYIKEYTGKDVFNAISILDKNVVFIFITSDSSPELAKELYKLGAYALLIKPFDVEYLDKILNNIATDRNSFAENTCLIAAVN